MRNQPIGPVPGNLAASCGTCRKGDRPVAVGWSFLVVISAIFVIGLPAPAFSSCGDAMRPNMVLFSATKTRTTPPGDARSVERTGVIVSQNGMILTEIGLVLDLLDDGAMGNRDISLLFDPRRLADTIQIEMTNTQDGRLAETVQVTVLGFDIARRLLLLKVPVVDQGYDPPAIQLSDFKIGNSRSVCTTGFKPDDSQPMHWTLTTNDEPILLSATGDITWRNRDVPIDDAYLGGAVFDESDGSLIGIVIDNRFGTSIVPIHYADTVLSQLFLSSLIEQLNDVKSAATEFRKGVNFDFVVLYDDANALVRCTAGVPPPVEPEFVEFPDMQLRIFYQRLSTSGGQRRLQLDSIRVRASVDGIGPDGLDDRHDADDQEIPVSAQLPYVEFSAAPILESARRAGFGNLYTLHVTLTPRFKLQSSATPVQSRRP